MQGKFPYAKKPRMNAPFSNRGPTPHLQYVRIDGQEWGVGELKGAFNTNASLGSLGLTLIATGAAFSNSPTEALVIGGLSIAFTAMAHGMTRFLDMVPFNTVPVGGANLKKYAIDRSGRAQPPENEALLLEQTRRARKGSLIYTAGFGIFTASSWVPVLMIPHISSAPNIASAAAMVCALSILPAHLLTHYIGIIDRCNKLLKHDEPRYRFCAKPPIRQTEKIHSAVMAPKPV